MSTPGPPPGPSTGPPEGASGAGDAPGPDFLSPRDDAAIRRLLADARATGTMPDHVADRLDGVLADLGAERLTGQSRQSNIASLAAARSRRRRVVQLLGAAAIVVIVGVGVGWLVRPDSGSDGGAATSADAPTEADAQSDNAIQAPAQRERQGLVREVDLPTPMVSPQRLTADLTQVRTDLLPPSSEDFYQRPVLISPRGFTCAPPTAKSGILIGIEYDGRPAVAVFSAPEGGDQVVDVVACDDGDELGTVTLPAP